MSCPTALTLKLWWNIGTLPVELAMKKKAWVGRFHLSHNKIFKQKIIRTQGSGSVNRTTTQLAGRWWRKFQKLISAFPPISSSSDPKRYTTGTWIPGYIIMHRKWECWNPIWCAINLRFLTRQNFLTAKAFDACFHSPGHNACFTHSKWVIPETAPFAFGASFSFSFATMPARFISRGS